MCPGISQTANCSWGSSGAKSLGSWTEPYFFCDQYTNDTVQSPAMQQWPCAKQSWPSCGTGCVQPSSCIKCFQDAGTWGKGGLAYAKAPCPDECYPEGLIANRAIEALDYHSKHRDTPFFLAVGFKRPHLSYRAPTKYFDMYELSKIPLPVHPRPSTSMPAIAFSHGVPGTQGAQEGLSSAPRQRSLRHRIHGPLHVQGKMLRWRPFHRRPAHYRGCRLGRPGHPKDDTDKIRNMQKSHKFRGGIP